MKINLNKRNKNIETKPLEDLLQDAMWVRIFNEHDESECWFYKVFRKIRIALNI